MKKIFKGMAAVAAGIFLFPLAACRSEQESTSDPQTGNAVPKSLKILTIGNSFSDDTMQYVGFIAKSAGIEELRLGNLYIGGCTLDMHFQNAEKDLAAYEYRTSADGTWQNVRGRRMSAALEEEEWDYISLQQGAANGVCRYTDPACYTKLQPLIDYVKEHAWNGAKLVWNMTWADQSTSNRAEILSYGGDQLLMYQKIVETVQSEVATKREIVKIVPTGTAIQNARTSFLGDTLTRDGYHLSLTLGRYIAGLAFFHGLTGIPMESISFSPLDMSAKERRAAREAAENAVKTPFAVTPSTVV